MPKKVVPPSKEEPNLEAKLNKEIATLKKKISRLKDNYLKLENKYSVVCEELAMLKKPQDLLSGRPTPDGLFAAVIASDKK